LLERLQVARHFATQKKGDKGVKVTNGSNGIDGFYVELEQLNPPCTDCKFVSLCADKELACGTFSDWVMFNINSKKRGYPNKAYYRRLFGRSAGASNQEVTKDYK